MARRFAVQIALAALAAVLPAAGARAACTWVQSVEGWNASVAWSYSHQAQWSAFDHSYQGTTQDQVSLSAILESEFGVQVSGAMDGTMSVFHRLVDIPPEGESGFVEDQASGPPDAYAPPPPKLYLFVDGFSCLYQFTYDTTPAAHGTGRVKSGCCTNTTDVIVESGDLFSGLNPIPEARQPLSFSGTIGGFDGGAVQDVSAATTAASDPTPTCGAGDRSVWFLVQVLEAGPVTVDTTGSDYGTVVSVWPMAEPCNALATQVTCGGGGASWNAEPGMYRVQVARASGAASGLVVSAFVPEPDGSASAFAAALVVAALRGRKRAPSWLLLRGIDRAMGLRPSERGEAGALDLSG